MADINRAQDIKQTTVPPMGATEETARRSAEAAQQSGNAASEAMRQSAAATADMTRQGAQAAGEAMRRVGGATSETLQRSTQAVAEGQRQIAQDTAQRFEEMSRKLAEAARGTSENVNQFFALPNAAEGGLQDMQKSMAGLVEGVMQTNMRASQEFLRLTNPTAVIELQQRFVREYLDTLMQGTATIVQAIRRTADETLRPIEAQVEKRRNDRRVPQAAE